MLRDVSVAFTQGESVAIVGESGSGKSTLLNLINRIDQADGGAVWIDGQELTALDERHLTLGKRRHLPPASESIRRA